MAAVQNKRTSLSISECQCPICMYILVEPVTLPCKHELCMPCYQKHVAETSLFCPMCRTRLSVWARKAARQNNLVDQKRWEEIKHAFPDQVQRRLDGNEESDLDESFSEVFVPPLAEPGALRREYEEEQNKLEAERLRRDREEEEASRQLLLQLQDQLHEQERQQREQEIRDLQLAARLSKEINGVTPQLNPDLRPLLDESVPSTPVAPRQTPAHDPESDWEEERRQQELHDQELAARLSRELNGEIPEATPSSPVTPRPIPAPNRKRTPSGKPHSLSRSSSGTTSPSLGRDHSQGHLKMWFQPKAKDSLPSPGTSQITEGGASKPSESGDNRLSSGVRRKFSAMIGDRGDSSVAGSSVDSNYGDQAGPSGCQKLRRQVCDTSRNKENVISPRKRLRVHEPGRS